MVNILNNSPYFNMDALMPAEMASRAEEVGVAKAKADLPKLITLAVLAGAFIALGAVFSTTVLTGSGQLSYGVARLLAGLTFSLGLILVVVAGAELFTGNNLIVIAWANGKVSTAQMLRNWLIVYLGNLVGSLALALLVYLGGQHGLDGSGVGLTALKIAQSKCSLGFTQALALGVLCNALVCLAVWLCFSARSVVDKIAAIIFPVTAFVAAGFEHCVANMYFIPAGILIKHGAPPNFWAAIDKTPADFANLTWEGFLWNNLLPVTLGNLIGGVVLVGLGYWFVYLRRQPAKSDDN